MLQGSSEASDLVREKETNRSEKRLVQRALRDLVSTTLSASVCMCVFVVVSLSLSTLLLPQYIPPCYSLVMCLCCLTFSTVVHAEVEWEVKKAFLLEFALKSPLGLKVKQYSSTEYKKRMRKTINGQR